MREDDQPWSSSYTRLLLRKKNRNYRFYKKYNSQYNFLLNQENTNPEILTKYLDKKNKAFLKARKAANQSTMANKRAKLAFFNSVNSTMNNCSISAKKKFNILQKLMKNNKFLPTPPFIENNEIKIFHETSESGGSELGLNFFLHLKVHGLNVK